MIRLAIYKRVSTDQQDTAAQDHAIQVWLAARPQYVKAKITVFEDNGISGKTDKRPGYNKLMAAVEAGKIDAVVVYRLDRLSRNSLTAMRTLLDWMHRDVEFFAVDQPILQLGKDNPLRLTVCALFSEMAQLEREAIVSRVKSGLAAARARGVRLGAAPRFDPAEAKAMLAEGHSARMVARKFGVSATSIRRRCK